MLRMAALALALALSLVWVGSTQPNCSDLAMNVRAEKAAALGGIVTVEAMVCSVDSTQESVAIGITLSGAVWSSLRPGNGPNSFP